jgi:hypothetical protein
MDKNINQNNNKGALSKSGKEELEYKAEKEKYIIETAEYTRSIGDFIEGNKHYLIIILILILILIL